MKWIPRKFPLLTSDPPSIQIIYIIEAPPLSKAGEFFCWFF